MRMGYFNRQGQPMSWEQWAAAFEDLGAKRVAETILPDGKWVSTVWLGLNHQFGEGPPLIFETMVFSARGAGDELDFYRYSTEAEAVAGHEAMVRKWVALRSEEER